MESCLAFFCGWIMHRRKHRLDRNSRAEFTEGGDWRFSDGRDSFYNLVFCFSGSYERLAPLEALADVFSLYCLAFQPRKIQGYQLASFDVEVGSAVDSGSESSPGTRNTFYSCTCLCHYPKLDYDLNADFRQCSEDDGCCVRLECSRYTVLAISGSGYWIRSLGEFGFFSLAEESRFQRGCFLITGAASIFFQRFLF